MPLEGHGYCGFDSNGAKGPLQLINNTAYDNETRNFFMNDGVPYVLSGNVSYGGGAPDILGDASIVTDSPPGDPDPTPTATTGNDDLTFGGGNDAVDGLAGNDVIAAAAATTRSSAINSGNDRLYGNGGQDTLEGGAGKDTLIGGAGADRFLFRKAADAGLRKGKDVIQDFSRAEGDKIHLAFIDADWTEAGDQAFAFIGTRAFTAAAGELRFASSGGISKATRTATGGPSYHRRSLAETGVYRYKTLIGPGLKARTRDNQKAEAAIAVRCINRFTALGMPRSIRIA